MDDDKKNKIAQALSKKGVRLPCPRCGGINFEIVGQTLLALNEDPSTYNFGPAVPCAMVACSNCGFITLHALGPLNLMPQGTEGPNK